MKKMRVAAVGLLGAALLAGSGLVSQADPDAVARAKDQLDRIQQEASAIDQQIIEASARAEESSAALERTNQDVKKQQGLVAGLSDDIGQLALVQYQTQGMDLTTQLFTAASGEDFLSSLGAIQSESDRSLAQLQEYQVEQAKLDRLQADAKALNASIQADKEAKIKLASEYDAKEAEAQAVYNRLSAEERERLRKLEEERQRRQEEEDRRAAEEAQRREQQERAARDRERNQTATPSPENGQQPAPTSSAAPSKAAEPEPQEPVSDGAPSDRAQRAVAHAKAQVGKRYVWGTSGPNTFDCSGLTAYAYRQVGINFTRSSRGQLGVGRPVSKGSLRPGDLVFYYSPVSHVGIYIGNGQIVHAANPRKGVRLAPLNSMPFAAARRVVN